MKKFEIKNDINSKNHDESEFSRIIESGLSRRRFMQGGAAAMGLFLAANPLVSAIAAVNQPKSKLMGFAGIPISTSDEFLVPDGYIARPLISWGDPILKGAPEFDESGMQPSSAQAGQFGDNTDGMSLFPLSGNRALMAVNNEYTNYQLLFAHGGDSLTADDVKKAQAAHGVSIFEVELKADGQWHYLKESNYNRRIRVRPNKGTGSPTGIGALI